MLPHRFVRSLTAVETRRIAELFRSAPQPRVRRRANTIRLSSLGYTVTQIAEVSRNSRQSYRLLTRSSRSVPSRCVGGSARGALGSTAGPTAPDLRDYPLSLSLKTFVS